MRSMSHRVAAYIVEGLDQNDSWEEGGLMLCLPRRAQALRAGRTGSASTVDVAGLPVSSRLSSCDKPRRSGVVCHCLESLTVQTSRSTQITAALTAGFTVANPSRPRHSINTAEGSGTGAPQMPLMANSSGPSCL
jgi:hypothetical protein